MCVYTVNNPTICQPDKKKTTCNEREMLTEEEVTKSHDHKLVILTSLSKCKTLNHLKQVQALVTTVGLSQIQFYAFKLLRFAAVSLADLSYTRRLFDSLHAPNVFVFAAAIAAHAADLRHRRTAFELYRLMLRRGASRPNHFVFPHALKSCAGVIDPRAYGSVHSQVVKTGFGLDMIVRTGLVGLYAKAPAGVESARKVFDEMPERNVVAWTAMVSGHARVGDVAEALKLFETMPERDVSAWNAVISGFAQNGFFEQAISLFERMMVVGPGRVGVRPNGVTVSSVLSACARGGSLRLGKLLHGYACRNGIVPDDPFVLNGLVDMYGKCGCLKDAKRVFDGTSPKSTMTWNSLINCYAIHGRTRDAIWLFEEMVTRKDGTTLPDEITFVGVLSACAHGGLVEEAVSYIRLMSEGYGIEPEVEHYGCLIDLLARAGRFDEATKIVNGMRSQRDEVVWSSLLNNSKIHRRVELAEFAVRKLEEIDPRNGWYAIMLANLYRDLGKWEELRRIRKRMKENNSWKTPGFSRIEIGERVWQFYAGDWSHPRVEEILTALESLTGFLTHNPFAEELLIQ